MNDTDRPENERVAYCQNCGKPLSADAARNVGSSVFCEPCLVAKVAAAESAGASSPGAKAGGSYGFSGRSGGVNYNFQGTTGPAAPPLPGEPNLGLAVLLGFIPGVGAFYNGQYAKGVVHLVVFAVLVTLSGQNGIFGLFVAGWIFYQVIEAHHTARARRDGTPLPNPFGLNDIGERLGFGRAWPTSAPSPGQAGAGWGPGAGMGQGTTPVGAPPEPPFGGVGEGPYVPPAAAYAAPPPPSYASYVPPAPGWGAPQQTYSGVIPPSQPDFSVSPASEFGRSRVPVGAILLIGLGVLFLIGNSGMFRGFPVHRLVPFLLIGIGVWLFVHKMMESGGGWADDGTPGYRLRLFRAARGAVWIVLVGVLSVLDSFGILSWGRSWPLFIIIAGVMAFVQRTAYSAVPPYNYVPPVAPPAPGPTPASADTAVSASSIESSEERERS